MHRVQWDTEVRNRFIYPLRNVTMKADPNLVPFRTEWIDNIGGMANAIFWLERNWESDLNAQGHREMPDGTMWFWNYSPINEMLLVHIAGSSTQYQITRSSMYVIENGSLDTATIYRPFVRPSTPVEHLPPEGESMVEWLKTREFVVKKDNHFDRVPLITREARSSLGRQLNHRPFKQFPNVSLTGLLSIPGGIRGSKESIINDEQIAAYRNVSDEIAMIHMHEEPFTHFHLRSYRTLVASIAEFKHKCFEPSREKVEEHLKRALENELTNRLFEGHVQDAALVYSLIHDVEYAVALEKVQSRVDRLAAARAARGEGNSNG